ncbi:DnaB-like helicase C-terminal domain-containing protein [Limnoglobus roseus]|uniref:DNA helicase n=1 Tax=Limnoglobus roseus TaxID=2598579 RepID=A0A5C1AJT7_9BACT|nr:DnaB-like helicase C-terminal domain-containing protein [Limnoglobus roseus]QEL19130.1 DNA helicase [Limnoglobus roseus]
MLPCNGVDVANSLLANLNHKPERWTVGPPFEKLDLRPGRIVGVASQPAAAKTTAAAQIATQLLQHQPDLRCVFACVDLRREELVQKIASRLAGVSVSAIMDGEMNDGEAQRATHALTNNQDVWSRIDFLSEPFTTEHLFARMQAVKAAFAVVDYVQEFDTSNDPKKQVADERMRIKKVLAELKRATHKGAGFLVISSITQQRSAKGNANYDQAELSLASFGGSSSIEYKTDDGYVLLRGENGTAKLHCVKKRHFVHGQADNHIRLRFKGDTQTFEAYEGDGFDFDFASGVEKKGGRK